MAMRDIIQIDEDKCTGCGLCIDACAEGALELQDGKAKLVREIFCDGLGACLDVCPTGALTIEKREAPAFDQQAVKAAHTTVAQPRTACPASGSCPGTAARTFNASNACLAESTDCDKHVPSALTHWPIQLKLASPANPVYQGADLLVAADCTAFTLGAFHSELLQGRKLVIACPKLDDKAGYVEKLTAFIRDCNLASITVARMEVPCCSGLTQMVLAAREAAGSDIPIREITVGIQGSILEEEQRLEV